MPKLLLRYIESHSLHYHLAVALLIGLALRLCSAWFVYGPQAVDDYYHGVLPAWQLFSHQAVTLPAFRSYLLVWLLSGFLEIAAPLGLHTGLVQVRAMYAGLGIFSLLAVGGTYLYVQRRGSHLFGALAIYLVALQPVMPFIATRAFGEAVALPLVVLGIALLEWPRSGRTRHELWWTFAGFLVIGLATLFRFQVGLIYVALGLVLLLERRWRPLAVVVVAGLLTLGMEIGIDLLSGRAALATLWSYLDANADGAAAFGVMPWYNTWLFILGLTLFPFSLVFWDQLGRLWREHRNLMIALLVFVAAHSLVPHKEERFLYPVIGLLWIALAALWSYVPRRRSVRWVYAPVFALFVLTAMPLALFNNTQAAGIVPFAKTLQRYPRAVFLDFDGRGESLMQRFFLQPANPLLHPTLPPGAQLVGDTLDRYPGYPAVVLLGSVPPTVTALRSLAGRSVAGAVCQPLEEAGSLTDRLLYRFNRKRNARRHSSWYLVCTRR